MTGFVVQGHIYVYALGRHFYSKRLTFVTVHRTRDEDVTQNNSL